MSFSIVHLNSLTISGTQSHLSDPVDTDLSVISQEKQTALNNFNYSDIDQPLFAVNYSEAGDSVYILGTSNNDSNISFDVPAGNYAEFTINTSNREAADQEISVMYSEIGMSKQYAISDNFSLEQLSPQGIIEKFFIPIVSKEA